MARASAPPWGPTQSCRIAVVRAAISLSLSERSRPETYFRKNSPICMGRTFFWVDIVLVTHDSVFRDVGGDFMRFRQRSDPLIIIELLRGWVFFFVQEHELLVDHRLPTSSRECQDLEKDAASAQRQQKREMMASRCSWRSLVRPGALMGACLTCGRAR